MAPRSGPTHVNDPDMLVVGIPWAAFATTHPTMVLGPQRPDLTDAEQRAHFSLWAMLAAPLLAGNDVRSMSEQTRDILTNRDVIAVDQDPLLVQGRPLPHDGRVIVKPLADGAVAVALFNPDAGPVSIRTDATAIGLSAADCFSRARSLDAHRQPPPRETLEQTVPAHGVAMLRVAPRLPVTRQLACSASLSVMPPPSRPTTSTAPDTELRRNRRLFAPESSRAFTV